MKIIGAEIIFYVRRDDEKRGFVLCGHTCVLLLRLAVALDVITDSGVR
jgi:hypothetical protein